MAGFDKVVSSYEAAMEGLKDGDTIIAGGFGLASSYIVSCRINRRRNSRTRSGMDRAYGLET